MIELPTSFWVRKHGRNQTSYIAMATDREEIYTLERPGYPPSQRLVGRIRIVANGKMRQQRADSVGVDVLIGNKGATGEVWWQPDRPLADWAPFVEGISVSRATDPDTGKGCIRVFVSYDENDRAGRADLLTLKQAQQLYLQLKPYVTKKKEKS